LHYRARTSLFANQKEHPIPLSLSHGVVCAQSGWVGVGVHGRSRSAAPIDAGAQGRRRRRRQVPGRQEGGGGRGGGRLLAQRAFGRTLGGRQRKSKGSPQKLICRKGLGEN